MKNFTLILCLGAVLSHATPSVAAPVGALTAQARAATPANRGNQGLANAYKANQRNTYYMVTQPDVDTACRSKIYTCLSNYCGDMAAVPGVRSSRCQYTTETELYNYAMLCLQKDTEILLPQYGVNTPGYAGGTNTAARLCPSYVQQEVMSYLAMANMSDQLAKSHSSLCIQRRQELEAAMSCHSVALAYGNETSSKLQSQLTDFCGAGVPGGSAEMVTRFATAGNMGANVWGWAEKIVSLDMNNKGPDWQAAVDSVLAGYANRMNLACGENLQINPSGYGAGTTSNQPSALQTAAALLTGVAFGPTASTTPENPYQNQSLAIEVQSRAIIENYATAKQIVNAALTNSAFTANDWFSPAQMDNMQQAYRRGTKVVVVRDTARCYVVPMTDMTASETSILAQSYASCVSR